MSEILPSRGLSLPTKIFFSFAAIIVAFGLTMGYTLVRQRRTLHDMTFISGGLLPVTLTVAEVRNTQELLVTTLESDPERRVQWLALVRQLRPVSLRRTAQSTRQAGQLAPSPEVTELMQELAVELEDVAVEALEQEPEYHELFEAFETGDEAQAQAVLESIIRREREVSGRLERVQGRIDAQITEIARNMARDERQLLWALLFLTIGALIVAAGLTFLSYRAVAPLSRLTAGVAAVGAGNLEQRVDIDRSDEIGTLAREFNRMTERLIEREQQLLRSERLAAIGKFVAKVTHDIRNPISSMGMSAEMLQEDITLLLDEEDRKEPLENLATITERLEYLEKLTSEYLAFARPTRPSLEPRDLDDQVENALNSESISFEASNIELHLVLSYELPPVRLDEVQFRRPCPTWFETPARPWRTAAA